MARSAALLAVAAAAVVAAALPAAAAPAPAAAAAAAAAPAAPRRSGTGGGGGKPAAASTYTPPDDFEYMPVAVYWDPEEVSNSRVRLCRLPMADYHATPPVYPMVEDMVAAFPDCRSRAEAVPGMSLDRTLGELEAEYLERGCGEAVERGELEPACAPQGIIFHESRCGSTVFSNMMASHPAVLMYSELGPPNAVIRHMNMTFGEKVHWLRVMYASMARPVALAGATRAAAERAGTPPPEVVTGAEDWSPRFMYLKTQHTTSLHLDVYQAAFPRMPWVYLHRDPVEVMMSLLRDNTAAPPPDAPPTEHINEGHMSYINNVPCMRSRVDKDHGIPPYVAAVTGGGDDVAAAAVATPAEDWCAGDLSWVITSAVKAALLARKEVLARAVEIASARNFLGLPVTAADGGAALPLRDDEIAALAHTDVAAGADYAAALTRLTPECVVVRDGMVLDATFEVGTVLGVGTTLFVDYSSMPGVVPFLLDSHLRPLSAPVRRAAGAGDACLGLLRRARAAGWRTARDPPPAFAWRPSWAPGAVVPTSAVFATADVAAGFHAPPYSRSSPDDLFYLTHPDTELYVAPEHDFTPAALAQALAVGGGAPTSDTQSPYPAASPLSSYTSSAVMNLDTGDIATMMIVSELYSKSRATAAQLAALALTPGGIRPFQRTGGGRLRAPRAWTSINTEGKYISDTGAKQTMAWAALRAAAARYLFSLRNTMLEFNVPFSEEEAANVTAAGAGSVDKSKLDLGALNGEEPAPPAGAPAAAVDDTTERVVSDLHPPLAGRLPPVAFDPAGLPLDGGYPQLYPLHDILTAWNPDIVTPPGTFGRFSSLRIFDYTSELDEAIRYRRSEVPFIVRNIPAMAAATAALADDDYLITKLGRRTRYPVDVNDSPHFMFYYKAAADYLREKGQEVETPTEEKYMTFPQWLRQAYHVADEVAGEEKEQLPGWWEATEDAAVPASDVPDARPALSDIDATTRARLAAARAALLATRTTLDAPAKKAPGTPGGMAAKGAAASRTAAKAANAVAAARGVPAAVPPPSPARAASAVGTEPAAVEAAAPKAPLKAAPVSRPAEEPVVEFTPVDPVDPAMKEELVTDTPAPEPAPGAPGRRLLAAAEETSGEAEPVNIKAAPSPVPTLPPEVMNPYHGLVRAALEAADARAVSISDEELLGSKLGPGYVAYPASVPATTAGGESVRLPSTRTDPSLLPYLRFPPEVEHAYGLPVRRPVIGALPRLPHDRSYLHLAGFTSGPNAGDNPWILEHMHFMLPEADESLFSVDGEEFGGIHCRFGMPGIIAESHYDSGRNMIALVRGYRRYILLPPDQCRYQRIMTDGMSARHSAADWTASADINGALGNASALEVILEPGDVLYLPASWFHLIVSLTVNIQCNARSGTPPAGVEPLEACGLEPSPISEKRGEYTTTRKVTAFTTGFEEELAGAIADATLEHPFALDLASYATPRVLPPLQYASLVDVVDDVTTPTTEAAELGPRGAYTAEVRDKPRPSASPSPKVFVTVPIDELVPPAERTSTAAMLRLLVYDPASLNRPPPPAGQAAAPPATKPVVPPPVAARPSVAAPPPPAAVVRPSVAAPPPPPPAAVVRQSVAAPPITKEPAITTETETEPVVPAPKPPAPKPPRDPRAGPGDLTASPFGVKVAPSVPTAEAGGSSTTSTGGSVPTGGDGSAGGTSGGKVATLGDAQVGGSWSTTQMVLVVAALGGAVLLFRWLRGRGATSTVAKRVHARDEDDVETAVVGRSSGSGVSSMGIGSSTSAPASPSRGAGRVSPTGKEVAAVLGSGGGAVSSVGGGVSGATAAGGWSAGDDDWDNSWGVDDQPAARKRVVTAAS